MLPIYLESAQENMTRRMSGFLKCRELQALRKWPHSAAHESWSDLFAEGCRAWFGDLTSEISGLRGFSPKSAGLMGDASRLLRSLSKILADCVCPHDFFQQAKIPRMSLMPRKREELFRSQWRNRKSRYFQPTKTV